MQRRRLLQATVAIVAAGLAGCIGGGPGDGGGDSEGPGGTPEDGGGGGEGPTESAPADGGDVSPEGPATSFEVTATRCGSQADAAEVTFDAGQVTIVGTTWGNDACYTARLQSATIDGGTLTVEVIAESAGEEGDSCAQCITEIEYRAFVETSSTPDEVVVVHDGETVTTATP